MATRDIKKIANFISATTQHILDHGVTLETGTDFMHYKESLQEQPEKGPVMPNFHPAINDFTKDPAFWIIGRNQEKEIVHTQALRCYDFSDCTLADYAENNFEEFTPNGWVYDDKASSYQAPPGSRQITGLVCCHGEFWLKGGRGGQRNSGMAVLTARLGMAIGLMKWSPEYIFAFMTSNTICKGLAARAGFMHSAQINRFWFLPGEDVSVEAWVTWVSRDDIQHLLNIPPNVLCHQLYNSKASDQKTHVA